MDNSPSQKKSQNQKPSTGREILLRLKTKPAEIFKIQKESKQAKFIFIHFDKVAEICYLVFSLKILKERKNSHEQIGPHIINFCGV